MLFALAIAVLVLMMVALTIARLLSDDELDRRQARPRVGPQGQIILERGSATRGFFTLAPVFFAGTALLILTSPLRARGSDALSLGMVFAAFAVAAFPMALRVWDRVEVTDQTVSRRSSLGRATSIHWTDIVNVDYHRLRGCVVLRARAGQSITVDVEYTGFSTFVGLLASHLPVISRQALHRLPNALLNE